MTDKEVETHPVSVQHEDIGDAHHTIEIYRENNAVLLDIRVDGEKGDAGSLKLAKDNHVRSVSRKLDLDIVRC